MLFDRRLSIGAVLLLLALAANAILFERAVREVLQSEQWVTHTVEIIATTNAIGTLLADAESGQRGFLLTGNEAYLQPFERASQQLDQTTTRLQRLTADNPAQAHRISDLQSTAVRRLALASHTIDLALHGHRAEAVAVVRSNQGRALMLQVRSDLEQIRAEEERLLGIRRRDAEKSRRWVTLTLLIATAIAAALVVGMVLLVDSGIRLRERANVEIRQNEQWFRTTLGSVGDAVIATDSTGTIRFMNAAAERATGYSSAEATGRPLDEIFSIFNESTDKEQSRTRAANPVHKVLETARVVVLANHVCLRRKDGTEIPIDDSAAPIIGDNGEMLGVVLIFRDVSERRQTEQALIASEKLSATVRLAGTVAHEINNPLASVTNLLYLASSDHVSPEQAREYVRMAESEIKRVAEITRRSLAFYRQQADPKPCRVRDLVDEIVGLYEPEIARRSLQLKKDYRVDGEITGWAGELRQVFANLLLNAVDASPPGGLLLLSICRHDTADGVLVAVEDEGEGIAEEVRSNIFKPFFTTKSERGNGLGLWASKRIVERHGGWITFTSRTDQRAGTRFQVYLPRVAGMEADTRATAD